MGGYSCDQRIRLVKDSAQHTSGEQDVLTTDDTTFRKAKKWPRYVLIVHQRPKHDFISLADSHSTPTSGAESSLFNGPLEPDQQDEAVLGWTIYSVRSRQVQRRRLSMGIRLFSR